MKVARVGQAAGALHECQLGVRIEAAQLRLEVREVGAQRRRQVGIEHGGVAALHVAHQRGELVRDRDLLEAELAGAARRRLLVRGVPPAVHEHDGERAPAGLARLGQLRAQCRQVKRREHVAGSIDALLGLDHLRVQPLRQHDVAGEDIGPILVADAQPVAEAGRGHEQHRLAAAGEERVGGDRRADLHQGDARPWGAVRAQQLRGRRKPRIAAARSDADRGHLAHVQRALRGQADEVGESAATVDPELPAGCPVRARSAMA